MYEGQEKTQIYKPAVSQDYISRQYYRLYIYSRKKSTLNYFDAGHPVVFYNNIVIYSVNKHNIYW